MVFYSSFEHGSSQTEFPVVDNRSFISLVDIEMMKTDTLPALLFLCIKKPI